MKCLSIRVPASDFTLFLVWPVSLGLNLHMFCLDLIRVNKSLFIFGLAFAKFTERDLF